MKIISQLDQNFTMEATCIRCFTEVECELSDLTYWDDQRDGSFVQFVCPVCNVRNSIKVRRRATASDGPVFRIASS